MKRSTFAVTVLVGTFIFLGPIASAQEVGIGATYRTTPRTTLPGGPGIVFWANVQPNSAPLRFQASYARSWGGETTADRTCTSYWPTAQGCVNEDVRRFANVSSLEATGFLLSPIAAGFRVAAGLSHGIDWFEVGRRGLSTGRELGGVIDD